MKNNTWVISTLVAGLLAVSGTASAASPVHQQANRGNITPADSAHRAAENTLTSKIKDKRGELLATQPGAVEVTTAKGIEGTERARREVNRINTQARDAQNALRGNNANLAPVTPASERTRAAQNTLTEKVEDARGELLATQPGRVELSQGTNNNNLYNNAANNNAANNNVLRSTTPISNEPLLRGEANRGQVTPADVRNNPAPITLQQRIKDRVGELEATQPGEVELQESRRVITR